MTGRAPDYQRDGVSLYLGDCREILPGLAGVDAVVTSPPYNQMDCVASRKPSGLWAERSGGLGFVQSWQEGGYADAVPEAEYQADQNALFTSMRAACNPGASLFYNHQLRWRDGNIIHPIQWFRPEGWALRSEIIWDRAGGMMFNARMFCRFEAMRPRRQSRRTRATCAACPRRGRRL